MDVKAKNLAPVILFVYNRPVHTRMTLEALKNNTIADHSILYVFADGPKENASERELTNIKLTREIVSEQSWCSEVILVTREKNMNLEDNLIEGISSIINKHGKAIILEDDLITSPHFLQYCNDGLDIYEHTKQVYSINAFMFPIDFDPEKTTFLSPIATSSWGWATWADRWNTFENDPEFINEIENNISLTNRFNLGSCNFLQMLKNMGTWDIRWYYTAFIRNGLGLFPTRSLVQNIGFDGSGSHGGNEQLVQKLYPLPIQINCSDKIDLECYAKVLSYFEITLKPNSITEKILKQARRFFSHNK